MRAVVVGTGWGKVHISALQELRAEVVAVCGTDFARTRATADEFSVDLALTSLAEVTALAPDLISVCAPTALHSQVVAELAGTPLLCEKPAVGVEAPATTAPVPDGPVWVNYPFGYLDVVGEAEAVLTQWWGPAGGAGAGTSVGPADGAASGAAGGRWAGLTGVSVEVVTTYDLDRVVPDARSDWLDRVVPDARSDWWWFTDLASHPWSWAVARFGMPVGEVAATTVGPRGAGLAYVSASGAEVAVTTDYRSGFDGIRHDVVVRAGARELRLSGEFHLGGGWVFDPVTVDGAAVPYATGASSNDGGDPWYEANKRSIAAVLATLQGGAAPGGQHVFTWQEALAMDACVQQLMP